MHGLGHVMLRNARMLVVCAQWHNVIGFCNHINDSLAFISLSVESDYLGCVTSTLHPLRIKGFLNCDNLWALCLVFGFYSQSVFTLIDKRICCAQCTDTVFLGVKHIHSLSLDNIAQDLECNCAVYMCNWNKGKASVGMSSNAIGQRECRALIS